MLSFHGKGDREQDVIHESNKIYQGDCLEIMHSWPDSFVQCVVTSPPYWGLRNYGIARQIGLEKTLTQYVGKMVNVFREVHRILREDGVLWLNFGDSYCGSMSGGIEDNKAAQHGTGATSLKMSRPTKEIPGLKPKDLIGVPWRIALALQADSWYLRSDIIWSKPNPMPESVTDRPTKSHEYIFLLTKNAHYFYDADAIKEKAIYFDDDRKGRALPGHKSAPDEKRNGIRAYKKPAGWATGKDHSAIGWATEQRQGRSDKQQCPGRRRAGFNDRLDLMSKAAQCSAMRNKRSVWTVATQPFVGAHFATFPEDLISPCILAGSKIGDIVLDPFMGAGTTALVACRLNRKFIGCELKKEYIEMAEKRIASEVSQLKFA